MELKLITINQPTCYVILTLLPPSSLASFPSFLPPSLIIFYPTLYEKEIKTASKQASKVCKAQACMHASASEHLSPFPFLLPSLPPSLLPLSSFRKVRVHTYIHTYLAFYNFPSLHFLSLCLSVCRSAVAGRGLPCHIIYHYHIKIQSHGTVPHRIVSYSHGTNLPVCVANWVGSAMDGSMGLGSWFLFVRGRRERDDGDRNRKRGGGVSACFMGVYVE